jgi:hypothetical protein
MGPPLPIAVKATFLLSGMLGLQLEIPNGTNNKLRQTQAKKAELILILQFVLIWVYFR